MHPPNSRIICHAWPESYVSPCPLQPCNLQPRESNCHEWPEYVIIYMWLYVTLIRMHQRCIEYTFSVYDNNIIYMWLYGLYVTIWFYMILYETICDYMILYETICDYMRPCNTFSVYDNNIIYMRLYVTICDPYSHAPKVHRIHIIKSKGCAIWMMIYDQISVILISYDWHHFL